MRDKQPNNRTAGGWRLSFAISNHLLPSLCSLLTCRTRSWFKVYLSRQAAVQTQAHLWCPNTQISTAWELQAGAENAKSTAPPEKNHLLNDSAGAGAAVVVAAAAVVMILSPVTSLY